VASSGIQRKAAEITKTISTKIRSNYLCGLTNKEFFILLIYNPNKLLPDYVN